MGQLIPLTLQPSRSGAESPTKPSPPPNRPLPEIPVRLSRRPTPEMSDSHLPHTQKEWHIVLDDVRSLYLKKQYKQCSARCVRLLEEVKDMEFPLYRIYISFYAATCLELTGRHMHMSSSKKLQLYDLARIHYQNAQHYMWQACKERNHPIEHPQTHLEKSHESSIFSHLDQSTTPSRSSICSITDSAVSLSFTTPVHSPASSISSFSSADESPETTKPRPRRYRKTVSFQTNVEIYKLSENDNLRGSSALPKISSTQTTGMSSNVANEEAPIPPNDLPSTETFSDYLFSRSLVYYQAHLASLGVRLMHHMSILDTLISEIQAQKMQPHQARSSPQVRSCNLQPSSKLAVRCDAFDGYNHARDHTSVASGEQQKEREDKMKARAERTKELKRRGEEWKNGGGRFDGRRYELLCGEVLRELDA